jgi:outer membrane biosynthesis protein TonB
MTSSTNPAGSITEATALLQAELPQLEEYQQTLEKELASVTERLESVRGALAALQALSATPIPAPREAESVVATVVDSLPAVTDEAVSETVSEPLPAEEPVVTPAPEEPAEQTVQEKAEQKAEPAARTRKAAGKRPAKTAPEAKQPQAKKAGKQAQAKKAAPAQAKKKAPAKSKDTAAAAVADASGLTDQVVAVLTRNADTPLRARDVAQALGRDESTGSINTVRSTLDRLVATSRAHRAGRGLYQAPRS